MTNNDYVGRTLDGKYQLTELLGRGGMGAVYKGRHNIIGKSVAVKFLHQEFATNEEVVKRFYREAKTAAAIGHANIINVLDVGTSPAGEPFLVMEYLEGESLGALLLRTGPLSVQAACGVLEPALLALHAAHAKGIVHRDLKPDNIFLVHQAGQAPVVKLIDFGISKFSEPGEKLTQTGSVMGTPAYMSPEQAKGARDLDHRSDLYSIGVILYEMLTGKLPFDGDTFTAIIINILTVDPVPPAVANPAFPRAAEPILLRSLVKNAAGRYQTALEFIEALKSLEGYHQRQEHLTRYAATITHKTFAAGDLGPGVPASSPDGKSVAANVLSQMMQGTNSTPAVWTGTAPSVPATKTKRTGLVAAFVALSVVVVLGGVAAALVLKGVLGATPEVVTISTQPALPTPSVEIRVEGAPAGAVIRYGEQRVPGSTFRVQQDNAIVRISVEAPGYAPFETAVVPLDNRVVKAVLKPIGAAAEP